MATIWFSLDLLFWDARAAATDTAPLGSTTNFAWEASQRTAPTIASSSTITISSTSEATWANVRSPGRTGSKPSATL